MLTNANAAGDMLAAKLSHAIALESAKSEAVSAKAELIESQLQSGQPSYGYDLDIIIDTALDHDDMRAAIKTAYLYSNVQAINAIIDGEITRLADRLAPKVVQAQLESMEDV